MVDGGSGSGLELIQRSLNLPQRPSLRDSVVPALIRSISSIGDALRNSPHVGLVGTANAFGDDQLNVDVLAERIIRSEVAANCPAVTTASSEEDPVEKPTRDADSGKVSGEHEQYTIAFDPLDGSSIIAPNWTVGTIIGIWDGNSALNQKPAEGQVAAILGVYGPRTSIILAVRAPDATCIEIGIGDGGYEIIRSKVQLLEEPFRARYFAPANLRASAEDKNYERLIAHYMHQQYTLRYSGGLVPDVVHTLVKGHGIYVSPVTTKSKAKLRRLYELAPIALIVECAGGAALDPASGKSILETPIEFCDERAGLVCGNKEEVEFVELSLAK